MSGFVYFIQCHDRIKIGFSLDPLRRLTKINADAPFPCTLLGAVSTDDFDERELHERFAAFRVHSEWFWASHEILDFVESSKGPRPEVFVKTRLVERNAAKPDATALVRWRATAKISQAEAAGRVGVSHAMWNRWETGAYQISAERCRAISALTGIPCEQLRPDIYPVESPA